MRRLLVLIACVAVGGGWIVARLLLLGLDPATEAYRNANRLWTVALAGLPLALAALFLARRPLRGGARSWTAFAIALAGAAALPAGSYIEFHRGDDRGWMVFGAGLALFLVGCLLLGGALRRAGLMPDAESRVVQSLGVLSLAGSIAGRPFFLFSLLFGGAWIWLGWRALVSPSATTDTGPATGHQGRAARSDLS